jgi:hypothetical protein
MSTGTTICGPPPEEHRCNKQGWKSMRVRKKKPASFQSSLSPSSIFSIALSTLARPKLVLAVLVISALVCYFLHDIVPVLHPFRKYDNDAPVSPKDNLNSVPGPCAILFYGLPRQFQTLVLPGIVENILRPNGPYDCDYFVHYHNRSTPEDPLLEARGADLGRGGLVSVAEIYALQAAFEQLDDRRNAASPSRSHGRPKIQFVPTTDDNFREYYQKLLPKLNTARWKGDSTATSGNTSRTPLYLPTSEAEPFSNATIFNILKMWLGQEAAWNAMEDTKQHYSRVAMLRNDMLYVTPMDIYRLPGSHTLDFWNQYAVIPGGFGNHPVNDRMIYGPYDAVRIWATGRLSRLLEHVRRVAPLGHGIHDEQFLYHTIFPAIRDAGIPILTATTEMCFLRVRSDQSIRLGDCGRGCVHAHNQAVIETMLERTCRLSSKRSTSNPHVAFLECPDAIQPDAAASSLRKYRTSNRSWRPCTGDA